MSKKKIHSQKLHHRFAQHTAPCANCAPWAGLFGGVSHSAQRRFLVELRSEQAHTILSCLPTSGQRRHGRREGRQGGAVPRNHQHGAQRRQSRRTGGGDQPNDSDEVIRRGIGVVRPACGFRPSRLVAGVSVPPPGRPYPSQGRQPLRGGEIRAGDELASGSDGCTIQRRCIGGSVVRLCDVVKMFSFISAATAHICRKGRRTRFYRVHPGTVRTIEINRRFVI